jgi:hypothetical protein
MSKGEWVIIFALLLMAASIVVADAPRSYLRAVFSGQCFADSAPHSCLVLGGRTR